MISKVLFVHVVIIRINLIVIWLEITCWKHPIYICIIWTPQEQCLPLSLSLSHLEPLLCYWGQAKIRELFLGGRGSWAKKKEKKIALGFSLFPLLLPPFSALLLSSSLRPQWKQSSTKWKSTQWNGMTQSRAVHIQYCVTVN